MSGEGGEGGLLSSSLSELGPKPRDGAEEDAFSTSPTPTEGEVPHQTLVLRVQATKTFCNLQVTTQQLIVKTLCANRGASRHC